MNANEMLEHERHLRELIYRAASLIGTYWQTRSEEAWEAEEPEIHAAILEIMPELDKWAVKA
jgi:hypothetical protein